MPRARRRRAPRRRRVRAVGRGARANRWIFAELLEEGLEPWQARGLLVSGHERPTHAIAVGDDAVEAAVRSLEAHRAYLADLPADYPPPRRLVPGFLRAGGEAAGTASAMTFRVFDLGGLLDGEADG